ncbi:flagellar M-ring protein FliF [Terribacillus saccharophilus]|uniref:Flagellar M-ring protein n=1 Tax=Terribacillus saccharophilus TaxID=361277 RepID=A0A075LPG7_9BACI|nr:flagellar basal-body MS-ring/collar protein FliF [Terribacillus goriensis]AIF66373.1 flagellar M-ring protein FliF [Terribacillus goriensis]
MNQRIASYKEKITSFWQKSPGWQKALIIGTPIVLILIIGITSFFATKETMVPLYKDLSAQEAGKIKEELDAQGVKYELQGNGSTILVPDTQAEGLLVDLAAEGLPETGSIDYSFFSNNASWGMTDNEFDVIKLDALQTELSTLLTNIDGIKSANVLINKPTDPVFVTDEQEEASASIVLNTETGYDFQPEQVEAMYRLVSKTVPNLPEENIVITNQDFEYINMDTAKAGGDAYTNQMGIKQEVEQGIQQRVQQMLAAMVGAENVRVSVTTDIDFDQETRTEELVEPVDEENNEGLPVSVETITETYEGEPTEEGGVAGTGEEEVPNVAAEDETTTGDGAYNNVKESVNYEFNKIKKEITESPYSIRDIGIQVAVDSNKNAAAQNGEAQQLTQQEQTQVEESITSILNSIVSTSVDAEVAQTINPENSVSVVFQPFAASQAAQSDDAAGSGIPVWAYIAGGVLLAAVAVLVFMLIRSRRNQVEEEDELLEEEEMAVAPVVVEEIDDTPETESALKQKQLEKLAQESPEDFAKLLRSWMAED